MNQPASQAGNPKAFVSYSWDDDEHRLWVRTLAAKLRSDGVAVTLDHWHAAPGSQLAQFMETAIRENDFVLVICTPRYKLKSDQRIGGVGYEGDIMTAEVFTTGNHHKFIPVLRRGDWRDAAPGWIAGKYYVDLRGTAYPESQYADLLTTLHNAREEPPPIGPIPPAIKAQRRAQSPPRDQATESSGPIKIKGIIVDAVTLPRNDGTQGSALYNVPFQLSARPSREWARRFVETWNHPPRFTTMHRPGIAKVEGDRVILDGTMVEEIERHHRDTLRVVVESVNELIAQREAERNRCAVAQHEESQKHSDNVRNVASRLKLD